MTRMLSWLALAWTVATAFYLTVAPTLSRGATGPNPVLVAFVCVPIVLTAIPLLVRDRYWYHATIACLVLLVLVAIAFSLGGRIFIYLPAIFALLGAMVARTRP